MRESSASCGAGEWSSLVRRWAGSPQARFFQTFSSFFLNSACVISHTATKVSRSHRGGNQRFSVAPTTIHRSTSPPLTRSQLSVGFVSAAQGFLEPRCDAESCVPPPKKTIPFFAEQLGFVNCSVHFFVTSTTIHTIEARPIVQIF